MESSAEYTCASADNSQSLPAAAESAEVNTASADNSELQPAAVDGGEESNSQEGQEPIPEEKKGHQKTLEERAEEIADRKIQQRIAESEARRQNEVTAKPDFIPVDYNAYDNHIAKLLTAEKQLSDELAFDPENPAELVRQIRTIQRERTALESTFEANEQKRQAWEQRNQQTQAQQAHFQNVQQEINQTVADIPNTRGITPEVLEAGRKFINEAFAKDPTLQKRFDAIITHKAAYQGFSGVQAAVEWSMNYAQENMGKSAEKARQQRETGKENGFGSAGQSGSGGNNINSFADLMKLPSKQINQFAKEHPQKFENLKEKHFK